MSLINYDDLEGNTVASLKKEAKNLGIGIPSNSTKKEIIEMIKQNSPVFAAKKMVPMDLNDHIYNKTPIKQESPEPINPNHHQKDEIDISLFVNKNTTLSSKFQETPKYDEREISPTLPTNRKSKHSSKHSSNSKDKELSLNGSNNFKLSKATLFQLRIYPVLLILLGISLPISTIFGIVALSVVGILLWRVTNRISQRANALQGHVQYLLKENKRMRYNEILKLLDCSPEILNKVRSLLLKSPNFEIYKQNGEEIWNMK